MRTEALLAVALLALGCGGETGGGAVPREEPVAVRAATVERVEVPVEVQAVGRTEALHRAVAGTRLAGRVLEVAVEEGDRVRRGQVLVRLDDGDLAAQRRQALAGVEAARAGLGEAAREQTRARALFAGEALPRRDLEVAETAHRQALAGVEAAEAAVRQVEAQQEYARVRAPIEGVVVRRWVQAGDMAMPGAPLVEVEALDSLKVVVHVGERQAGAVRPGDEVRIELPAAGGWRRGWVRTLVPAAEARSRTFRVEVALEGGAVGSGLFVRALLPGGRRPALLLPAGAIVRQGQLEGAYAVEGERARLRWVRLGRRWQDRVEVLSGLEAGQRVVADPEGVRDGAPLEVRGDG